MGKNPNKVSLYFSKKITNNYLLIFNIIYKGLAHFVKFNLSNHLIFNL